MTETDFARKIADAGGRAYIVGGWVRDCMRGVTPHDKDYVVTGLTPGRLSALFPGVHRVGGGFPVYLLRIDGIASEVALARSDTKDGTGYRGFRVSFTPETAIEDDLRRRDTTMNSIAHDILTGARVDPFGGAEDIAARTIRATSEHFADDPVRALRAARQSAQFGFRIEPRTVKTMGRCREELAQEPGERFVKELRLALESAAPSRFFRALATAEILDAVYPEIHALIGRPQPPRHHPEGDAFEHTMQAVDRIVVLSARVEVRFAALAHDLGKALTPDDELPHHYGHERLGLDALAAWNARTALPRRWVTCARLAIREHMRAGRLAKTGAIVDLLGTLRRHPLGFDGMEAILRADGNEAPDYIAHPARYLAAMDSARGAPIPERLHGPKIALWFRERQIKAVDRMQRDAPPEGKEGAAARKGAPE
jgi:tRNA nucleotidyltransferase/poly(A) polymerase